MCGMPLNKALKTFVVLALVLSVIGAVLADLSLLMPKEIANLPLAVSFSLASIFMFSAVCAAFGLVILLLRKWTWMPGYIGLRLVSLIAWTIAAIGTIVLITGKLPWFFNPIQTGCMWRTMTVGQVSIGCLKFAERIGYAMLGVSLALVAFEVVYFFVAFRGFTHIKKRLVILKERKEKKKRKSSKQRKSKEENGSSYSEKDLQSSDETTRTKTTEKDFTSEPMSETITRKAKELAKRKSDESNRRRRSVTTSIGTEETVGRNRSDTSVQVTDRISQRAEPKRISQKREQKRFSQGPEPRRISQGPEPRRISQETERRRSSQRREPKQSTESTEPGLITKTISSDVSSQPPLTNFGFQTRESCFGGSEYH